MKSRRALLIEDEKKEGEKKNDNSPLLENLAGAFLPLCYG